MATTQAREYVNHCCWNGKLGRLRTTSKEAWLKAMKTRYASVSYGKVYTDGMVKAWCDTFDVLQTVLQHLPTSYDNLYIFFEYALPMYEPRNGVVRKAYAKQADVILLSRDCVVILEFKQNDKPYIAAVHQAQAYRRRIQEWHDQSRGMTKRAFVVLTRAAETRKHNHKVDSLSPDLLPDALIAAFGDRPAPHNHVREWQNSSYSKKT